MTHEERVKRIAGFGFTHRQAAFLIDVMLHSGFFLGRQVGHRDIARAVGEQNHQGHYFRVKTFLLAENFVG